MRRLPSPILQSVALFLGGLISVVFYLALWFASGHRSPAFLETASLLWGAAWLRVMLDAARLHGLISRSNDQNQGTRPPSVS